jgi:hypothetical protein
VPPFDLQRLNSGGSLVVTRPSLAHFVATRDELEERAGAVLGAVGAGRLAVRIGARFPLAAAATRIAPRRSARDGQVLLPLGYMIQEKRHRSLSAAPTGAPAPVRDVSVKHSCASAKCC